jgi:cytoskeletal protein RodZ
MSQLGDTLSDERRRQGKSLVEVEATTRIRSRSLEALEHGDYDHLPAAAYVKGYIQSYAKYLDIPAQPLLEMYKADMRFSDERESERERPVMPRGARYSKVSRQNLEEVPAESVVASRSQAHAIPMRTWVIAAGGIVALFLIIWGVSKLAAGPSTPPPVPASVQETTTINPAALTSGTTEVASSPVSPVPADGSGTTSAAASANSTAGITPFRLTFRIHSGQTSTLKITADGTVVFDATVSTTADFPTVEVYRKAVIVIGNPMWVTTMQDGVRKPTPNQTTPYTLTLKNGNAP